MSQNFYCNDRYIDCTGDLQTVCWITVRCLPPHVALLSQPCKWLVNYRDLLDSWQLWTERADFDIEVHKASLSSAPPQQVIEVLNEEEP